MCACMLVCLSAQPWLAQRPAGNQCRAEHSRAQQHSSTAQEQSRAAGTNARRIPCSTSTTTALQWTCPHIPHLTSTRPSVHSTFHMNMCYHFNVALCKLKPPSISIGLDTSCNIAHVCVHTSILDHTMSDLYFQIQVQDIQAICTSIVCMYLYICTSEFVCLYLCLCICICVCVFVFLYVYLCICVFVFVYFHSYLLSTYHLSQFL